MEVRSGIVWEAGMKSGPGTMVTVEDSTKKDAPEQKAWRQEDSTRSRPGGFYHRGSERKRCQEGRRDREDVWEIPITVVSSRQKIHGNLHTHINRYRHTCTHIVHTHAHT